MSLVECTPTTVTALDGALLTAIVVDTVFALAADGALAAFCCDFFVGRFAWRAVVVVVVDVDVVVGGGGVVAVDV